MKKRPYTMTHKYHTHLPEHLEELRDEIERYALEYGLDFFEVVFEVLDWNQINEVAAYGGFPNRYPHWRFGMEYEQISKGYEYGFSKIYEMVINNDPCYAYLLHSNSLVDQKLVMAHVYAHSDFFKNNVYFAHTNRKMMDEMANHKARVARAINRFGQDKVESFIDDCLSLETLIDPHAPAIQRRSQDERPHRADAERMRAGRPYMEKYVNPKDFVQEQQQWLDKQISEDKPFPENPLRDVMLFLLENAPLEGWEADILSMIREEAYYFVPQGQTKIINEGWSAYWHSKILTERALKDDEIIDFADRHSSSMVMSPGKLNPYKLGIELFRDIEDRWNKGRFGREYEECNDMVAKRRWDKKLGQGRDKIFEVRRLYNDLTLIDTFLTPEFCQEQKLFVYAYNVSSDQFEIANREFDKIKKQLLFSLTNMGRPVIEVVNGNFQNRGELLLVHRHEGMDLRVDYARATLMSLYSVWRRPVYIETVVDGTKKLLGYTGSDHTDTAV